MSKHKVITYKDNIIENVYPFELKETRDKFFDSLVNIMKKSTIRILIDTMDYFECEFYDVIYKYEKCHE